MVVTNFSDLPQAIVDAVSTEKHSKDGEISVTELLKGAKATVLTNRHWEELTVDAADSIWQIWGTAVHSIFEMQNDDSFKEEKFSVQVQDKVVTGRVDNYDMKNEVLADFKTCSAYKIIFKDFDDWRKQGLAYSWVMKQNGLNVKKCKFVALIKDHSKTKAKTDAHYPKNPVFVYEFDVTDEALAEIESFIRQKVADISKAETMADDDIPECSAEERWAKGDTFAVKKPGRKTAVKVFDDKAEAEKMAAEIEGGYVEERKGESVRCSSYCSCCNWCSYYKERCQQSAEESAA